MQNVHLKLEILEHFSRINGRIMIQSYFNFHFNHSELYKTTPKEIKILKIWELYSK